MIKPDLSKWKYDKELEGLLLFAQVLQEMLFHHTIDTYKAPALNVETNLLELRYLVNNQINNRNRAGNLEPVLAELESRMKSDPVIHSLYSSIYAIYINKLKQQKSRPHEMISTIESLFAEIYGFYWVSLKKRIISSISDSQRKAEIIALATVFITEAEFHGYSRGYLNYQTHNFFFRPESIPKKIVSHNQIEEFLKIFDANPSGWQVIFKGSEVFKKIDAYTERFSHPNINIQIFPEKPKDIPSSFVEKLNIENPNDFPLYLLVNIEQSIGVKEPVAARDLSKKTIEILSDVYSFAKHEGKTTISEYAVVVNKETKIITNIAPSPNPMSCGLAKTSEDDQATATNVLIDIVNGGHFDQNSTNVFVRSLDYHKAAFEAETPENQLLDLWASLEGFLPSPPADSGIRIQHYIRNLIPALTLTYTDKIFRYMTDAIYYGPTNVRDIVDGAFGAETLYEKVVAVISSRDLLEVREKIYTELDGHPLLRNRIYQTHQAFMSKRQIKKTIQIHKERVSWHIQRIYTTRNQIIHNADSLPYLRTLVENLHTYVDLLIENTAVTAISAIGKLSIAAALSIINAHEENFMRELDGQDVETESKNFRELVFGKHNHLSPFNHSLPLGFGVDREA